MPSFCQTTFVNGISGDPAVFGFCPRSGQAIMFDLGSLRRLPAKLRLKVRTVLVSHTHVDHFIGFDELLRVNIPHHRCIDIVGPQGITRNVFGKLTGYTWNLLTAGQIRFKVTELCEDQKVRTSLLENSNGFEPQLVSEREAEAQPLIELLKTDDGLQIGAVPLDHGCVSLAFLVKAPTSYPVDIERVKELGLEPGAWIRDLQTQCQLPAPPNQFDIAGTTYMFSELAQKILKKPITESIAYITDVMFSLEACEAVRSAFDKPSLLICESSYAEQDRQRAFRKKHLTSKQAALFAAAARAEELRCFHVSKIYAGNVDRIIAESREHFSRLKLMTWEQVRGEIIQEASTQEKDR